MLAQTFMENSIPDPRLGENGTMPITLRRQLNSYRDLDGNEQRQKAIPASVVRKVAHLFMKAEDPVAQACAQLIIGAFFFAMRSCEYSKTTSPGESKTTKILTVGNIRFFKESRVISHSDPHLPEADIVAITFESQKNKDKFKTICMHRSNRSVLCPVRAWAAVVQRVRSYKDSKDNSQVNLVMNKTGKLSYISSTQIRTKLRAAAATIGAQELGFEVKEIGCHSLRSGSAMAMYIGGVPVTTIQLIGQWKSDAFLRYIREQVDCFTLNVSSMMTKTDSFFTIPDPAVARTNENKRTKITSDTKIGPPTESIHQVFEALVL